MINEDFDLPPLPRIRGHLLPLVGWLEDAGLEELLAMPLGGAVTCLSVSVRVASALARLGGAMPGITLGDLLELEPRELQRWLGKPDLQALARAIGHYVHDGPAGEEDEDLEEEEEEDEDLDEENEDHAVIAAGSPSAPQAPVREVEVAEPDWQDRQAVTAWCRANGLSDAFGVAIDWGAMRSSMPMWAIRSLTLGRLLFAEREPGLRRALGSHLPALAEAGRRRLVQAVREQRERAADTTRRLAALAPIEDPVLAAFAARLRPLRATLLETVPSPAITDAKGAAGSFEIRSEPPEVRCRVVATAAPGLLPPTAGLTRLELGHWREGALVVDCGCPRACVHAVALVERVLFVAHAGEPEVREALRAVLAQPPWERLLHRLDQALAPAPASTRQLSFRLDGGAAPRALVPYLHKPRKGGGWTAGSRVQAWSHLDPSHEERRALEALSGYHHTRGHDRVAEALVALIGHPRVFVEGALDRPIEIRQGRLGLRVNEEDGGVHLCAAIAGHPIGAEHLASDGDFVAALDREHGTCWLAEANPRVRSLVRAFASSGGEHLPEEALPALLERLPALEHVVEVALPERLLGARVDADACPVVRLRALPGDALAISICVRPHPEGTAFAPGEGPERVSGLRASQRALAVRDLAGERSQAEAVRRELGELAGAGNEWALEVADLERALDCMAALRRLSEAGAARLEWEGERLELSRPARSTDLSMRVRDRKDWFGLEGALEIDGERLGLAVVLDAVRRGQRYLRLEGRRFLALEGRLRERLSALSALTREDHGKLALGPLSALAVEDLADDGAHFDASRSWSELRARARHAMALEPALPEGLSATLRPYQADGYQWMMRLAAWGVGACLADDMGLGKTVQALTMLLARAAEGPALVVAPTSVCAGWLREAARFAPSLHVALHAGEGRTDRLGRLGPSSVIVASYGVLVRDAEALADVPFATLVLDEAQAVKNAETQRAKAARQIRAPFRVALSGTPIENHLGELWSLFRVISPGLFGSWEGFRDRFAQPIERGNAEAKALLGRLLRPFVLRRTKAQVAPELPPRTEVELAVELSEEERRLYEDARLAIVARLRNTEAALAEGSRDPRFEALAGLTRLRRLACHPRLYDARSNVSSSKLQRVLRLLDDLRENGHRALVFSQFTSHLALVREALDARGVVYQYLDGQTPQLERQRRVDAFQVGQGELFLISLKAGGTGINLTAADYVLHLDPWWNPAVEDQATDRAHRIGQDKPVTVYKLVARGTVEDAILEMQRDKRALVSGLLEEGDPVARLSTEEMISLLEQAQAA